MAVLFPRAAPRVAVLFPRTVPRVAVQEFFLYNASMKKYSDDDGRQIANMEGLDDRNLLGTWFGILDPNIRSKFGPKKSSNGGARSSGNSGTSYGGSYDSRNMGSEQDLSPEDRKALIKYLLKYSLGLGMIFLVAFGLVIAILIKLWT